jgi:putative ABC transport system permease protein
MGVFDIQFSVEARPTPPGTIQNALITVATPGFFETLRVPVRAGRAFNAADRLDAPPVMIVNESFAARYLSGLEPIGQRMRIGDAGAAAPWATVVGVVADYRNSGPTRAVRPAIYMPVRQQTAWNQLFVLVRGTAAPAAMLPSVREAVKALDPEQPIYAIQSLEDALAQSSFQQRTAAILLSLFAAVALLMAAVGVFGVMSYAVAARTQELGVRLALGAQPRDVRWLVFRQVLTLAGVGLAIGLASLATGGRVLSGLLYGVEPADPVTMVAAAAVLGAVAIAAAWIPAARAARIDPIDALRYE